MNYSIGSGSGVLLLLALLALLALRSVIMSNKLPILELYGSSFDLSSDFEAESSRCLPPTRSINVFGSAVLLYVGSCSMAGLCQPILAEYRYLSSGYSWEYPCSNSSSLISLTSLPFSLDTLLVDSLMSETSAISFRNARQYSSAPSSYRNMSDSSNLQHLPCFQMLTSKVWLSQLSLSLVDRRLPWYTFSMRLQKMQVRASSTIGYSMRVNSKLGMLCWLIMSMKSTSMRLYCMSECLRVVLAPICASFYQAMSSGWKTTFLKIQAQSTPATQISKVSFISWQMKARRRAEGPLTTLMTRPGATRLVVKKSGQARASGQIMELRVDLKRERGSSSLSETRCWRTDWQFLNRINKTYSESQSFKHRHTLV